MQENLPGARSASDLSLTAAPNSRNASTPASEQPDSSTAATLYTEGEITHTRTKLKFVTIGSRQVGKTSLNEKFDNVPFPRDPPFEKVVEFTVKGKKFDLTLCATLGQDELPALRALTYKNVDVFLICFSIDDRQSFTDVSSIWSLEVRQYCPKAAIILVGTKGDLRKGQRPDDLVSKTEAKHVARTIGAVKYKECSAVEGWEVKRVFKKATLAASRPKVLQQKSILSCFARAM